MFKLPLEQKMQWGEKKKEWKKDSLSVMQFSSPCDYPPYPKIPYCYNNIIRNVFITTFIRMVLKTQLQLVLIMFINNQLQPLKW